MKKLLSLLAALVVGLGLAVAVPTAASASGPCGAGYNLIGHHPIKNLDNVTVIAYLDVYYNGYQNCAVTMSYGRWYGVPKYMRAQIRISGSTWHNDDGLYSYYAGPVYSGASAGKCIDLNGLSTDGGNERQIWLYNVYCG